MGKPDLHVVSLSGGKDSTAMLLKMLENKMQIDCILFCDTGLEFPTMYEHLDRLEKNIERQITRIRADETFEYLMFDKPIKRKSNSPVVKKYGAGLLGYGWAGARMRWCTSKLKDVPRERFLRELRKKYNVVEYVGIAADEQYRLERERNKNSNHRHPLVEWNMTESDCLEYCYSKGFDWDGLYDIFHRVSCWCCPLQSLAELRQLYAHFPDLWEKLKEWDKRTWRKFRADYSVEELEVRFDFEDECVRAGKSVTDKAFFTELKRRLNDEKQKSDARQLV